MSDDAQDLEGVGLLLLRGRVMALLPAVRAVLVLAALVLVAAPELLLDCLLALLDLLGVLPWRGNLPRQADAAWPSLLKTWPNSRTGGSEPQALNRPSAILLRNCSATNSCASDLPAPADQSPSPTPPGRPAHPRKSRGSCRRIVCTSVPASPRTMPAESSRAEADDVAAIGMLLRKPGLALRAGGREPVLQARTTNFKGA